MLPWLTALTASARYPADEGMARAYCDTVSLNPLEGIWEFPEDDTRVLICRAADGSAADYDIVALSSPDCRITPGQKIGNATKSADARAFTLSLCRQLVKDILADPAKCSARLSDGDSSLTFKPRKLTISLRTLNILPNFWRRIRFNIKAPDEEIPKGMVKIYPIPYGSNNAGKTCL